MCLDNNIVIDEEETYNISIFISWSLQGQILITTIDQLVKIRLIFRILFSSHLIHSVIVVQIAIHI